MKTASLKLSDLVTVASRFGRSVNLERDFYRQAPLGGYVLTTTARAALDRLAESHSDGATSRAWTLTGPYGSGKSAFALFAAKALSANLTDDVQIARNLIKDQDRNLWQKLFDRRRKDAVGYEGLCPVIVSGSREPLNKALLRGLETAIEQFWPSSPPLFLLEVRSLLEAIEAGERVTGRQVVEKFEQMADKIGSSRKPGTGLLVVIDELGKLLEYAAAHPHESDIFLLQELAEATKREAPHPIFLITVLHQAFDRYVEKLARSQREEWVKVQGRFEDIAFQEPADQILRIIAEAIRHQGPCSDSDLLKDHGRALAGSALKLGLVSNGGKKEGVLTALAGCTPLHPTVSLVLGPFFRRIGQNERSLFAFLTSREPHGFNDFISNTEWKSKAPYLLRLDSLYDYIITALGSALYAQSDGKKWAEIESALNRSRDANELEIRLIKTIGLLRIIGDIGNLTSSQPVLEFACGDGRTKSSEITEALNQLQQRSVVVFRRYNNAFSLWEGSDVDIEAKLQEARAHIDPNASLPESLTKYFKPRPIVARRHSLATGTLRFFGVRYIDLTCFDSAITEPLGDTDGLLLYAIALTAEEAQELARRSSDPNMADYPQVTIAIPQETSGLRDAIFEVACLTWVRDKTPELEGDRTARNELHARLANAEAAVERLLQSSFRSNAVRSSNGENCEWYRKGVPIKLTSERDLQGYISRICDEVFHSAPVLRNELINRRHLSSSAASARRELIVAMLQNGGRERLGIERYPPHASMFFSLLVETGMHREESGKWGFFPPKADAAVGIKVVWSAIDRFLAETEVARKSVEELFSLLSQPPFGMKSGPLPVLLCAALLHYDTEVALYEQGSFVPSLSNAVFERLVKAPGRFQVQRCRVAGVRASIFKRFASVILQKPDNFFGEKMNVLSVVRPLTKFAASLPPYTRNTQRLSKTAIQVRGAIFEAREPDKLLFSQLPIACGLQPFVADESREGDEVDLFFKQLRASLAELQRTYDDLLNELEVLLVSAFSLKGIGPAARNELRERAQPLLDLTVEPKLKSFLIRAIDDGLDPVGWLEAIATFLATKPPASWFDNDLARFEVSLADVARSFSHIELLSFELRRLGTDIPHSDNELMRIGVTTLNNPELERVVLVTHAERSMVDGAAESVEAALTALGLGEDQTEMRLSVLAKLFRKMLKELEGSEANRAASAPVPRKKRAKA